MTRRPLSLITALMLAALALVAGGHRMASAQETQSAVDLRAEVDPTVVTVGDPIRCVLHLEYDEGVEILTDLKEASVQFNNWWVTDQVWGEPHTENGRTTLEHVYVIATFETGEFEIPSFTVKYRTIEGKEGEVSTQPVKIKVESVLPTDSEAEDIKDVAAPVTAGEPGLTGQAKAVVIAIPVLLLIVVSVLVFLLLRRKEKPPEPPRPAHEVAMERFRLLRESESMAPGQEKIFAATASDILREYLLGRYGFDARDLTTTEIQLRLKSTEMTVEQQSATIGFLEECDLVKFAKRVISDERKLALIESGEVLVSATMVLPVSVSETTEGTPDSEEDENRSPSEELTDSADAADATADSESEKKQEQEQEPEKKTESVGEGEK